MMERAAYYIELLMNLCGYNGNDDSFYFGWFIVLISIGIVIYAFYEGISKAIWPGEESATHIKYQILDEFEHGDSELEDIEHAH